MLYYDAVFHTVIFCFPMPVFLLLIRYFNLLLYLGYLILIAFASCIYLCINTNSCLLNDKTSLSGKLIVLTPSDFPSQYWLLTSAVQESTLSDIFFLLRPEFSVQVNEICTPLNWKNKTTSKKE